MVATDRRLVRIIVRNLLENAIKYTEAGHVEIGLSRNGAEARVVVRDTGIGVSQQDQARIFQPFEQLEPVAHKQIEGVGLGLAIVQEITELLGGCIDLQSTPGTGSAFTLVLPLDA